MALLMGALQLKENLGNALVTKGSLRTCLNSCLIELSKENFS